jgi:hypothetical protein
MERLLNRPRSEAEYAALIARFESQSIPRDEWRHADHVIVAFWYVSRLDEDEAVEKIRTGIQRLNAANGVPQTPTGGYHETWTVFFAKLLRRFVDHDLDRSLPPIAQMEAAIAHLADFRGITRRHYSAERIDSWEARTTWLEPDLLPLPGGA